MAKDLMIRSSSAEFLIFERQTHDKGIQVRFEDGDLWLTQKAIGELFNVDRTVVTKHIKNIYSELELNEDSTTRPEPSPEVQAESAPTPVEDDEKVEDIEDDRIVGAEPDHEANEEDLSDQELPEYNFAAAPPARANEVKPQAEPESLSLVRKEPTEPNCR